MNQTSRVLCAVDLSKPAQAAFRHALALSRARGAALTVVHAVSTDQSSWPDAHRRIATIEACHRAAEEANVRFNVSVRQGDPVAAILQLAGEIQPELIVIGTHQRTGLERWRIGSVAEGVTQRASSPVLIVPAGLATADAAPGPSFANVLCAVDFAPPSSAAYQQALSLAAKTESRMTLVHVVQVPEYHSLATLDAWRMLQAAIPRDKKKSGRFQVRVVTGDPAAQIVRIGADVNADVIVVGVSSRNPISRRLFGATAARVMRTAGRPVLAVPEPARRSVRAAAAARALDAVA